MLMKMMKKMDDEEDGWRWWICMAVVGTEKGCWYRTQNTKRKTSFLLFPSSPFFLTKQKKLRPRTHGIHGKLATLVDFGRASDA